MKYAIALLLFLLPGVAHATVSTTASSTTAQGNGVTSQFTFAFDIPSASNAVVTITDTTVSPTTNTVLSPTQYTITGIGLSTGGSVTYPKSGSPLANGQYITIARVLPLIQTTSLCNQGVTFCAIEHALDYLTMITQQIQTEITSLIAGTATPVVAQAVAYTTNIASLRLNTLAYPSINVEGYYSAGDAGGGLFNLVPPDTTSADNGGAIIVDAAGHRYYRNLGNGQVNAKWFGAAGDDSTNDTTSLQNWLNYLVNTCSTQAAGFWPTGTYKITVTLTISVPVQCQLPNLFTAGSSSVAIDAGGVGNNPAIYMHGGNGGFADVVWQGVSINGGTAGTNEGIRNNTGYMILKQWQFVNEGIGLRFYNLGTGTFTEGVVCEDCVFDATTPTWVRYSISGGGTTSFRGSGLRRGTGNINNSSGGPIIVIDSTANPYLAPMSFTAWTGSASTVNLIQNNGSVFTSFLGDITLERTGGTNQIVNVGETGNYTRNGALFNFGVTGIHKGTEICVSDYNVNASAQLTYTPCNYSGSVAPGSTGATLSVAMPFSIVFGTNMQLGLTCFDNGGTGYIWSGIIPVSKSPSASTLGVGVLIGSSTQATIRNQWVTGSGSWPEPTIGTSALNVTLANADWTTTTICYYTWVPLFTATLQ